MEPPVVSTDRLDGWQRVERDTDRPFSAGPVSVTAATVRYDRVDGPKPRPFFFASRLRIRPETPPNAALTRFVENRARAGFRDRLAERDIGEIEPRGERTIAVDDPAASRATLWTFRGTCRLDLDDDPGRDDRATVPVEALLAVWETGEYLLGGGAYPLTENPERARRELVRLIRGTRPA